MKDNFSANASSYAQFRPVYPAKLYDYLLGLVNETHTAWDCGCGNGQVAHVLSEHFQKVIGTDISSNQISLAVPEPNIEYRIMPAEKTDIGNNSVDLITVAQAIHWFDFEEFYNEVLRVSKPGSILAVWCYSLLEISPELDAIVSELYADILGATYWDNERHYIEERYQSIPFPFDELQAPDFKIETEWTFQQLIGYLNSWSAVQHYITQNSKNPVDMVSEKLLSAWGEEEIRQVSFPIFTRIGKISR